jgi:hypothetical protein
MADDSEDPDIKAGREIAAGKKPVSSPTVEDPDIAAGRAIATAPPTVTQTGPAVDEYGRPVPGIDQSWPAMTWRGTAREIAGALPRIAGNVVNVLSDPYANLVGRPALTAYQTAHDFLAPMLGYDRMSDADRNALYADFGDQPGTNAIKTIGRTAENVTQAAPSSLDPYNIKGTTPAEKLVGTAVEGAGTAAALGPGSVAVPVAGGVGAVAGRLAGENVPPWLQPGAELAGNVVGATATGVGTSGLRVGRGAVTDVSTADAALGQVARDKYQIPIDANDLSSNSLYRISADQASKLPFSGAKAAADAKQSAWQGAIAKEMGENATAFTPDVMDRAKTRIGAEFDRVARTTSIDAPSVNTMVGDLATIERDMNMVLPTNELPKIKAQLDNIIDVASKQGGTISGQSYQALTRKGAPLDLAERSADPNVRHVAGQIRDALDDAFVRSAAPTDQAALVQAKYQYRVMRTVDQLAAKSRDGNITPEGFRQQVLSASRKFDAPTGGVAYTGGGNIGELSRIGQLMRTAPQTGTADRGLINLLALGGTGAPLLFNPAYAATVPAMLAANRVGGAYLRSGFLANQVVRNALQPPLPSPFTLAAPVVTSGDDQQRR